MNAEETNQPDRNQVEGDDVVEQLGHHENQDAGKQGYEGCEPEMEIQETSFVFDTAAMHGASPGRDGNQLGLPQERVAAVAVDKPVAVDRERLEPGRWRAVT
jgi:hypothetical protein